MAAGHGVKRRFILNNGHHQRRINPPFLRLLFNHGQEVLRPLRYGIAIQRNGDGHHLAFAGALLLLARLLQQFGDLFRFNAGHWLAAGRRLRAAGAGQYRVGFIGLLQAGVNHFFKFGADAGIA